MFKNQDEKLGFIGIDSAIIGIDVAKRKHFVQPIHPNRTLLGKAFQINNTREGFENLLVKFEKIKQEYGYQRFIVGLESTGHYWKPLMMFLTLHNIPVVLVNPHHVKKSKELDDNAPSKFDPKDAGIIGKLVNDGRFFEVYLPKGAFDELRVLNNTRDQIKTKLNAIINVITAILDEYFPEFETVFKEFTGKTASHILYHYPFPEDLKMIGVKGIIAEFKKAIKRNLGHKRALSLYQKACQSIGVPANKAARIKIRFYLDEYKFLTGQLESIEKNLEQQLMATGIGDYLLSIKGVGVITAAGLLAELGDPNRFISWKQIRKLAGYNLVENSSGDKKGRMVISKRGRAGLRNVLYKIALGLITNNQEFKSLYRYLLTRKVNPLKKKQALVAISMKFIKVILALVKNQEMYNPARALGEFRENQLKAA